MGSARTLQYLVGEPAVKRSLALFMFRAAQILHERGGGRFDASICRLAGLLKPKSPLPPSRLANDGVIADAVTALDRRGWAILPWRLAAADLDEIRRFAFSTPAYADDPTKPVTIDAAHILREHGRYQWRISDLIRVPAVQRLIADSALHRIAQDYIGCRPMLTSITLWLDPVFAGGYDAHVYHYDNDGPRFLKFFIYVNDVNADNGAHTYIQNSHAHVKPKKFRLSRRYDRDALLAHYGDANEIVFAAPAGTILAEDTAGFHKGTDLRRGYRLLMQLVYGAIDIPHAEEFTCGVARAEIVGLDPEIQRVARKFYASRITAKPQPR